MAANSKKSLNGDGHNKIYKHQWRTHVYGLPMSAKTLMEDICEKKFGWHFVPHKDMDYRSDSWYEKHHSDSWYEKQTLVISFESKTDLITSKLNITL